MKYNQKLPVKVEKQLDAYIERIKTIKWFQPSDDLKKGKVDKQIKIILEAFGVKGSIEYRKLRTAKDWDAAWGASLDASWKASRDAARDATWDAAWGASLDASWKASRDAARDATWDAAWGASLDASW